MKKLGVALAATIVLITVFLAILPRAPSALAQYSWTDTINLYKNVNAVYTDIRKITNNETVAVDVLVYITFTEKINLFEYYKLSANGTNFIIISQGTITQSNGTYYGLQQEQTLCFIVEAKGGSTLTIDDTAKVGVKVEFWSAEPVHDIAITHVTLYENVIIQGCSTHINLTVENQGDLTETFNATAYCNNSAIILPNGKNYTTITLTSGNSTTITFTWNTTGWAKGNYTISAYAWPIPGETDVADNNFTDGTVVISILGDVNGDYVVDVTDYQLVKIAIPSWPSSPKWNPNADLNDDGLVDVTDYQIVKSLVGTVDP